MEYIYATLIEKGIKNIDQVPASIRAEVQRILDERKA